MCCCVESIIINQALYLHVFWLTIYLMCSYEDTDEDEDLAR